MKTTKQNTYAARWTGNRYEVRDDRNVDLWISLDGDVWEFPDRSLCRGDKFEAATIHLHGGPRDGETVG